MVTITGIDVVFLTILFNVGLIFAYSTQNETSILSTIYEDDVFDYHLPDTIIPLNYDIILRPVCDIFYGTVSILIHVIRATSTISFHSEKLAILYRSIRLDTQNKISDNIKYKLKKLKYDMETQTASILYDSKLSPGFYILSMNYSGILEKSLGFVRIKHDNGRVTSYVTLLEPNGARRVFPCWDEPRFKATFNISVDHMPGYQVFSNMQKHTVTQLEHNYQIRTSFEPTFHMSTYLVTIGILDSTYGNVTNDRIWFSKQVSEETSNRLRRIIKWTDNYLMNYTDNFWLNSTTHAIAFPHLPSKIVGGWECAVFRDSDIVISGPPMEFFSRLQELWKRVTYGLVRHCIETIVNPSQWSDLWLSKALELYVSYNIIKQRFTTEWMTHHYVVQVLQPAMHEDVAFDVPPVIHKYDPFYSSFIHRKAFVMINMLEYIITKKVLKHAIADYLNTYAYSSASASDFFKNVNTAVFKLTGKLAYNITPIMTTWLSHRKYPTLLVTRNYSTNTITISYDDTKHILDEHIDWVIPITYSRQKHSYFYETPILWSSNTSSQFYDSIKFPQIDRDEWILLNEERFGYYRVNYDNENWLKIAYFLTHNDHWKIYVLARAQILDDAYHFVMKDRMDLWTYLTLIRYLKKETEYIVWHSMMNTLNYMSIFFNFPESERFKNLMLLSMDNVLTDIGNDENNSIEQATQLLLLNWACKHGDLKCRQTASNKLSAQLTYPRNYSKCWMDWIFCAGLMNASNDVWETLQHNFAQGNDLENIHYLACNENDDMIIELLSSITSFRPANEWSKLVYMQRRKLYDAIIKKHIRKDTVLDFILVNFDRIFPSHMSQIEKIGNVIMNLYSKCQIEKVTTYMTNNPSWNEDMTLLKRLSAARLHQINMQRHIFVRQLSRDMKTEKC